MTAPIMSQRDYAAALAGVERAAGYQSVQARINRGHEFAALMEPGGLLFAAGHVRRIASNEQIGSTRRRHIVCTDGSEFVADQAATRNYGPPPSSPASSETGKP